MIVRSIIAFGSEFWAFRSEHNLGHPFQNSFELGYPGLSQVILLTCAGISRHIPSYTELSHREISQDIPGYPKTRFLSWDIPLQVFCFGLSRVIPGHPGITLHVVFPDASSTTATTTAGYYNFLQVLSMIITHWQA